jgi:hypothetical protein
VPPVKRGRGRPQKHLVTENAPVKELPPANISMLVQETSFTNSQRKEINRLLKKGIFVAVTKEDVLQGVCIFNLRFVNKIKHLGTNRAYKKSRLVMQAYNN